MIGTTKISVEIAASEETRYKGLSNRALLCDRCGMLFVFEDSQPRSFVMREMNFDLDMIWLDNKTIIGWSQNLKPEAGPYYTLYKSPSKADMVLEVPAGFVEKYKLKVGDKLSYE